MVMERGHGEHWAQKTAPLIRQHKRTKQSYTQPVSLNRLPHNMQKLPRSKTVVEFQHESRPSGSKKWEAVYHIIEVGLHNIECGNTEINMIRKLEKVEN